MRPSFPCPCDPALCACIVLARCSLGMLACSWTYNSSEGVLHAVGFGVCLALMVTSYLKAWLSDPGTVEDSSWMQVPACMQVQLLVPRCAAGACCHYVAC